MLYMRWAALPADPAAARRLAQHQESRCVAERPLLRTPLAPEPDANPRPRAAPPLSSVLQSQPQPQPQPHDKQQSTFTNHNGDHETAPSAAMSWSSVQPQDAEDKQPSTLAVKPNTDDPAAPNAGREPHATHKLSKDSTKRVHSGWHPAMGPDPTVARRHFRSTSAGGRPFGHHTHIPKSSSEDQCQEARRLVLHALLPHCECPDYIASALHAADKLGPAAHELRWPRGALEKKYARLTMPYIDYSSYLHNLGTGRKATKPHTSAARSMWRSGSTLAVVKHTSVAELATLAVSKGRTRHEDRLGGISDEKVLAQLQSEIKLSP